MSGIRALEKLRGLRDEAASKMVDNPRWVCMRAEEIADAIEAEVAERYMELPVDADGVPVRVGDMVYGKYIKGNPEYTVMGYEFDQEHGQWNIKVGPAMFASANLLCHKPRTVEDVLLEFVSKMNDAYNDPTIGGEDREDVLSMILDDYAAELRELLGGAE